MEKISNFTIRPISAMLVSTIICIAVYGIVIVSPVMPKFASNLYRIADWMVRGMVRHGTGRK